ncbi:MAG: 1-deoxy-D-xylulose-5-phosphate reductoisomerase [Candidatus Azotimanducaceae bacterium]|jgi:1-deoxy-D-xylulose-5-phosphate reductoisomerase
MESPQQVTILGSTGSIGLNTLDVIKRNPDRYSVFALTANRSIDELIQQCHAFNPRYLVLRDEESAKVLKQKLGSSTTEVLSGAHSLSKVASDERVDIVMAAIVGAAGLESSLAAARSGKRLLLANKESLVMAGALFMQAVKENGATLLPIDSEHNAIFQCLANGAENFAGGVSKLILTSSGGPLLRMPKDKLKTVTPDEACAHPNFKMGRKISVDSATMMNKGLELIEASWLFNTPASGIEIVLHPQQIIHSMVAYKDGSLMAQMGYPDMRTPIAHGLSWPARITSGVADLDLINMGPLDFENPDTKRFPSLILAREAANGPDSHPIALNAANEIAVDAFLHELICFIDIPVVVESVLDATESMSISNIDEILAIDETARMKAREVIAAL